MKECTIPLNGSCKEQDKSPRKLFAMMMVYKTRCRRCKTNKTVSVKMCVMQAIPLCEQKNGSYMLTQEIIAKSKGF